MKLKYTVLTYRGIGEHLGQPKMADDVVRHLRALDPDLTAEVLEVPYSASYGPIPFPMGESFDRSLENGLPIGLDMIRKAKYPVIQVGFSAGAALAGNVTREATKHRDLEIATTGLISDPFRDPGNSTNVIGQAHGWGVAKKRYVPTGLGGIYGVIQVCDPSDVICCCPKNSPIRTIADQTSSMSLSDPIAWGLNLTRKLVLKEFQQVLIPWTNTEEVKRIYGQAIRDIQGYMGGDHTSYATRDCGTGRTYTDELAQRIHRGLLVQEARL